MASPFRINLSRYLQTHPLCEEYVDQDIALKERRRQLRLRQRRLDRKRVRRITQPTGNVAVKGDLGSKRKKQNQEFSLQNVAESVLDRSNMFTMDEQEISNSHGNPEKKGPTPECVTQLDTHPRDEREGSPVSEPVPCMAEALVGTRCSQASSEHPQDTIPEPDFLVTDYPLWPSEEEVGAMFDTDSM